MNPLLIKVISYLISISVGLIVGWKINSYKHDSERLAEIEGQNKALEAVAIELSKIEVNNVTIRQKLETKVIDNVVYRECKHDADGLRVLNEAITGKPISDSKLPGTVATDQ
jgi:hypothetical protein